MKVIKTSLATVLLLILMFSLITPCFALPINVDMVDNYFYPSGYRFPVQSPIAYRPTEVIGRSRWALADTFDPSDTCVFGDYLYIVDKGASQIIVVDEEYNLVKKISAIKDSVNYAVPDLVKYTYNEDGTRQEDPAMARSDKYAFKNPSGIFIDDKGLMYVADTENRRVVVCDLDGNCQQVYQAIHIDVLGVSYVFKPLKIVVDMTGTMSVTAYGVNKGLIQIDSKGSFLGFFGAPAVSVAVTDWIFSMFATPEQMAARVKSVPAEYNSILMDSKGFLYTVCSDTVTGGVPPIQKLTADGLNLMTTDSDGRPIVFGDPITTSNKFPVFVDIAVNEESNTYTILDSTSGRFFTYDVGGRLLYIGGGAGNQNGRFKQPTTIVSRGNQIVITDTGNKTITVYETTDYAELLTTALSEYKKGKYDISAEYWTRVTEAFSNMPMAYQCLGNIEVIKGREAEDQPELKKECYTNSLKYFVLAEDMQGYSNSFKELRNQELSNYFTVIFVSVAIVFIGIIVLIYVRKYRKERAEEQRRVSRDKN